MEDVLKSHSVMKVKATMLANLLSLLPRRDEYTSLDELQVSNDLQYCFKISVVVAKQLPTKRVSAIILL